MDLKRRIAVLFLVVFVTIAAVQAAFADKDVVQVVSGVVRHMDKGAKTMVVKASDGTEHTIKWTGKSTWKGTKETGKK